MFFWSVLAYALFAARRNSKSSMSSPSDDPKSPQIGSLLDLLNASDGHDGQVVDFTTSERPVASHEGAQNQLDLQATRLAALADAMRTIEKSLRVGLDDHSADIAQSTPPDESFSPDLDDPETRYAAHIVHAMKRIKKDHGG